MRTLFYTMVTMITEMITGLEHDNLRLWNVGTYINKSQDVTVMLNVLCLIVTLSVILGIIYMVCCYIINKREQKLNIG